MRTQFPRFIAVSLLATAAACLATAPAHGIAIEWVTVGDAGNAADTTGHGAVGHAFQIMKYEFTNTQYAAFLNAVDPEGTNPYVIRTNNMLDTPQGGLTMTGTINGSRYGVKENMGDKPATYINWWSAARVANWLEAGAQTYATTASGSAAIDSGVYALNGANFGPAPAKNANASYWIPTEDEWYKAAYYKGGGTNAGYWDYATGSDTAPTPVSAGATGNGLAGSVGNSANYDRGADWAGQNGNVTTVGTNGRAGAYGTFDMSGNVAEWTDYDESVGTVRGIRGGSWIDIVDDIASTSIYTETDPSDSGFGYGFRLASPVATVPEPSTWAMGAGGLACAAWSAIRRRRRA